MKIWNGYGTEHSSNLVMIGSFKTQADAHETAQLIHKITECMRSEVDEGKMSDLTSNTKFSEKLRNLLHENKIYTMHPVEVNQFLYDINVNEAGSIINITTDEYDFSALVKILVEKGGKVEVYSAHDYPRVGSGRDTIGG